MELFFEIVIETILEWLLDESIEGTTTNKYPKPVRYVMTIFVISAFIAVFGGLTIFGILLMKDTVTGGIAILCIDVFLLILAVRRFRILSVAKKNIKD